MMDLSEQEHHTAGDLLGLQLVLVGARQRRGASTRS
jgi:hypothetical protein